VLLLVITACSDTNTKEEDASVLPPVNAELVPQAKQRPNLCFAPRNEARVTVRDAQHPNDRLKYLNKLFTTPQGQTYGVWYGRSENRYQYALWLSELTQQGWGLTQSILENTSEVQIVDVFNGTGGNIVIFYMITRDKADQKSSERVFEYIQFTPDKGWETPVRMAAENDFYGITKPFIAQSDAGHWVVTWIQGTYPNQSIKARVATPTLKWGDPITLSTVMMGSELNGGVAASVNHSGQAFVAWVEDPTGTDVNILVRYYNPSTGWASKNELVTNTNPYYLRGTIYTHLSDAGQASVMWAPGETLHDPATDKYTYLTKLATLTTKFGAPWPTPHQIIAEDVAGTGLSGWGLRGTSQGNLVAYWVFYTLGATATTYELQLRHRLPDGVWQPIQVIQGTPEEQIQYNDASLDILDLRVLPDSTLLLYWLSRGNKDNDDYLRVGVTDEVSQQWSFFDFASPFTPTNVGVTQDCRKQITVVFNAL